eukprot:7377105-Prymnesium_polylepis.1
MITDTAPVHEGTTLSKRGRSLVPKARQQGGPAPDGLQRPMNCRPSINAPSSLQEPARRVRANRAVRAQQAVKAAEAAHSIESGALAPVDGILADVALHVEPPVRQPRQAVTRGQRGAIRSGKWEAGSPHQLS